MYKAFLDMDGVIADFMSAICKAHNRPNPYYEQRFAKISKGTWDTEKLWGITPEEFWAPIQDGSLAFWEGIQKTAEADRIVRLVCREFGVDNVAILTAPSNDAGSVPGKRKWLEKNYPQLAKNIILTSAKQFLAGPGRILIDDRDKNILDFEYAGGAGILIPRPWNSSWAKDGQALEVLERGLSERRVYGK